MGKERKTVFIRKCLMQDDISLCLLMPLFVAVGIGSSDEFGELILYH